MRIVKYLNTTKEEVESKKFNIWIGISLGNKYFTRENIKEYIKWSLNFTKEDILVAIPDRIHAINLEILNHISKLRAFRKTFRMADEKIQEITEIVNSLPESKRSLVNIGRWNDITKSKYNDYRTEIVFEEFREGDEFYKYIISIVRNNFKNHLKELNQKELEKLSEYVLYEIPLFLNGVKYAGRVYSLIVYPGTNQFDDLLLGLQNGILFPDLSKKLKITDKIAILDAYVN